MEIDCIRTWIDVLTHAMDRSADSSGQQPERHSAAVPFSFDCGGRSSREWLKAQNADRSSGEWMEGRRLHRLRWRDPETSLLCDMELVEFREFPAMEWVIRLRNDGDGETAPIAHFKALDTFWKCPREGEIPELRRAYGSDGRHDDFQYVCDELRQSMWNAGRTIRMDSAANAAFRKVRNGSPSFLPIDGRASATWLPFFNLRTGGDGLISAVGWSGQWFAEFEHDGRGKTAISAGMEHLDLTLRPGEQIRSPRVLLLYWQGEPIHGHNVLRRFILQHHSPHVSGRPVEVPVCNGTWGGTPTARHLATIEALANHQLAYDYYWVDAGWYGTSTKPCPSVFDGEWSITGDWRVNRRYHPDGLKPVSDAARRAGMKFLLWIEPERATYGTPVTLEHPEWFLRSSKEAPKPDENLLLNLAHPGAWQWAVETVSSLVAENGIDCYREDFNTDPSPFWANADEPGRKGWLEIRFVEGLYAFWDELRRRHPGLLIDNCASGGRRLELETVSRSVALWRTDYNCFPHTQADASQVHTAGLHLWLPLNSTSPMAKPGDTYQVRSAYSAGLVLNIEEFGLRDCNHPDFPWDWFRKRIIEAKRLRPYFYGDYYPLTPCIYGPDAWMAYQLSLPDKQEGAVMTFRRAESPMVSAAFQLHGLDATGTFAFEDADSGDVWHTDGNELTTRGLAISIDAPRASRLLFYRLCEKASANKPDARDGR
ncbi:MAG: alpha-galactosidase [Kiritimatiellae bacterium]|nr:alpha-galactosidase [Kiritimatiellia bacterium]